MEKKIYRLALSKARRKLAQLEKILKPGEALQITKRGRAYARIELAKDLDHYEEVLKSIESLPDAKECKEHVAANYKQSLYRMNDGHS